MRCRHAPALAFLLLAVSCGGGAPTAAPADPGATATRAWPLDGFLDHLPAEWSTVLRLPPAATVEARPDDVAALLRQWGLEGAEGDLEGAEGLHVVPGSEGLDRTRGPGFARTPAGHWHHYLPAADKGLLNRSLQEERGEAFLREEGRWVVLSSRAPRGTAPTARPLPPGDLALRTHGHPLLRSLAGHGDALAASATLGGAGLEARAWLEPGDGSATRAALDGARAAELPGLLDYIPSSLGLRLETTLPPTVFASLLARHVAVHAGMREGEDRVVLERLLRELLTGADPATGLAVGVELEASKCTVVFLGRVAGGPASPILANLRRPERASFGALVVDPRDAGPDLVGKGVWVIDAQPDVEGCPASALGLLVGLAGGEAAPLPVAWRAHEGWFAVAAGARPDRLVRSVLHRVTRAGARRSEGSSQLLALRDQAEHAERAHVLGFVAESAALDGLEPADAAALRAMFGMRPGAPAPRLLAVAGFLDDGDLLLDARLLYAPPGS